MVLSCWGDAGEGTCRTFYLFCFFSQPCKEKFPPAPAAQYCSDDVLPGSTEWDQPSETSKTSRETFVLFESWLSWVSVTYLKDN